jgi:thioredoxin reductase (NADPH)
MTTNELSPSLQVSRHGQTFPTFDLSAIDRMRRFGEPASYGSGERIVTAGAPAPGLVLVLSGRISVTNHGALDKARVIATHSAGQFMGELAQLSDRPSLVNAEAAEPVEGFVIAPRRLRDLMVQEAELGERIMRALILRRVMLLESGQTGHIIIGKTSHPDVVRLQGFLTRNGQPHQVLDPDQVSCARTLIERFDVDEHHLPIVLCANGKLLRNPGESEIARCIGLVRPIDGDKLYDVAIVGAGPAGLAAAVYAASEGLSVINLDCRAFGGQAGASARIENYLGFPTGISGLALMARAANQAQKFGVEMAIPDQVHGLERRYDGCYVLSVGEGEAVQARSVVVATGVRYRRPRVEDLAAFEGSSVHYWASPIELRLCGGADVALVGAGNSAGQAAVFLASQVRRLTILARGASLHASMSRYLVDRIEAQPNIEIMTETELVQLHGGEGRLDGITWRRRGEEAHCPVSHLFLFIGADPETAWLARCNLAVDDKGFILTGGACGEARHPLESNLPGVFAIGDVRAGSVKRVAAAVGEGAQVVAAIHAYLAADALPQPIRTAVAE